VDHTEVYSDLTAGLRDWPGFDFNRDGHMPAGARAETFSLHRDLADPQAVRQAAVYPHLHHTDTLGFFGALGGWDGVVDRDLVDCGRRNRG
jgi:hypothetical protein